MESISIIIPTYKEPEYLDICLNSLFKTQTNPNNEVIVIVDGFYDLNKSVLSKYSDKIKLIVFDENKGLSQSLNQGVSQSINKLILVVNDDNVFCSEWDKILLNNYNKMKLHFNSDLILTINQIEFNKSIYKSIKQSTQFNNKSTDFNLSKFLELEPTYRNDIATNDGYNFPFLMSKKDFMKVGGWDINYESPHIVDFDFFLKLQLCDVPSMRTHALNFYHFGGKATKNNDSEFSNLNKKYSELEQQAYIQFYTKWGFHPVFNEFNIRHNNNEVKGINFKSK